MNKTKIDWADMTWNPVTGCLHGCEYCYARKIANRFGGASETHYNECVGEECQWITEATGKTHELDEPVYDVDRGHNSPYPFEFDPTLHCYRLGEPFKIKKPQTIFVCSMADLFGEWIPGTWIKSVLDACNDAPQHRYLFLTKNPDRYSELWSHGELPENHWYGHTITKETFPSYAPIFNPKGFNNFISIEPLLGDASKGNWIHLYQWVIVGSETGNRKDKIVPKKEWIDSILEICKRRNIPIFMKESLRSLMGDDFIQEFPWEDL